MAVAAGRLATTRPLRRPQPRTRTAARSATRPRARASARRVPFALFALCVVAAMIVGLAAAQALVAQDSFRLAELTRSAERLEEDYGRLRLRAAELSSPERIAQAARRAGLVPPRHVELVKLPPVPVRPQDEGAPDDGGTLALKGVLGGAP